MISPDDPSLTRTCIMHDHDSFDHSCPACNLAPRQARHRYAWGFEPRTCGVCGETKGGDPYRLCKCERTRDGLGDEQPHIPAVKESLTAQPPKQ